MAQVDNERAVRNALAALTADQPAAPPHRYIAARRRAIVHRRRQLAGAAAAVAVLVAAAIAIPLGLLHIGPTPPAAQSRHYHLSVQPPGPGAPHDLIASGWLKGVHWREYGYRKSGMTCMELVTSGSSCGDGPPPTASTRGAPASVYSSDGTPWQVDILTVRTDVTSLQVSYDNGQVLTLHPEAVFGARYARFVALPTPYSAAVTSIAAYGAHGEIGSAVPFTGDGFVNLVRWLAPYEPVLPRPSSHAVGSGRIHGNTWRDTVSLGPWGTCFTGVGYGSSCSPATGWPAGSSSVVRQFAFTGVQGIWGVTSVETSPAVRYLMVSTAHGATSRVTTVAVGGRRFVAAAALDSNPLVHWTAYARDGQELGSGGFTS